MRRSRAFAGLFLLALTFMAGPAVYAAESALAGIYKLSATNDADTEILYLTVMLKGSQVVLLVLTPDGAGPWYAGAAELTGQQVTGIMFDSGGEALGPFDLQLTPERVEGTMTTFLDWVTVTGVRVF